MSAPLESSGPDGSEARVAAPAADDAARRASWLVGGGVLLVWAAHNAFLLPWEVRHIDAAVREPLLILLRAVIWMVPALLYLRRHDPRRTLDALGVTSRVNRRGLGKSAAGGALYLSLIVLLLRASAPPDAAGATWAALAPLPVLYMLVKAALEELLMRGFLLGQFVRFTSSFRAQAAAAVLFTSMHLPNWIAVERLGIELIPSTIAVLVLGLVLGAVARASNNILPAIALHFANNLVAELLGGR